MQNKKILYLINSLSSGGAERLVVDLINNSTNEFKIDVVLFNNSIFYNLNKNVKIYVSPYKSSRDLRNILYLKSLIKRNDYDVVHAHLFPAIYFCGLIAKYDKSKRKYIYTEHSTYNKRRRYRLLRYIELKIYSYYDSVVSISEGVRENLVRWLKIKKHVDLNKFIIIENAVDLDKFILAKGLEDSKLMKIGYEKGDILLCMVGSFSDAKDQKTIIKSLNFLKSNIKLILIGSGQREVEIKNMIRDLKLNDRVYLLGNRSNIPQILKTIDIYIQSSNWEGFGLSLVEAAAAGKPVLASNVSGMRDLFKNKNILFNKGDYKQLANKINDVINNPKKYTVSRSDIFKYDIKKCIKKYMETYRK